MLNIEDLKFDADGLIPVTVQDYHTKEVLTLAYMNRESLRITLAERRTCFWSRSRQELWRKGETSGNIQQLVSLAADCDGDALVAQVIKSGPACHTGSESCFSDEIYRDPDRPDFSIAGLYELISGRKNTPKSGSYTSYLFEKGSEKILKKIGEESAEVIIAAMKENERETIYEIADLCYHVLVLMAERNIPISAIRDELASRHVVDKKTKQETPN